MHADQLKKLTKYFSNYKNSPYIPRVHGQEISLMVELVLDNDNKDLFSQVRVFKKKKSARVGEFNSPKLTHGSASV